MTGYPQYVTPPEQLKRTLRDLLRGWQEVVFRTPGATDDYRALAQRVLRDADASLENGATPYEVAVYTLAPIFAAADEETVTAIVWPDDENEAAAVRRAVEAGAVHFQAILDDEDNE